MFIIKAAYVFCQLATVLVFMFSEDTWWTNNKINGLGGIIPQGNYHKAENIMELEDSSTNIFDITQGKILLILLYGIRRF